MTREQFNNMSFDELMEWAYENLDDVTDEDALKHFAMDKLENYDFGMVLHIIGAIYDNPYDTDWYRYDYCMGRLHTPSPITDKEDIEDLIFFEDEEMNDEEKISKIKEVLMEKNGVADSQEFGLSYSQAINYLDKIEAMLKG